MSSHPNNPNKVFFHPRKKLQIQAQLGDRAAQKKLKEIYAKVSRKVKQNASRIGGKIS